jgi:hypothetical protein
MGKTEKNGKKNYVTKVTKNQRRKYGMNKTIMTPIMAVGFFPGKS